MKKRLILTLAIFASVLLASCNGNQGNNKPESKETNEASKELCGNSVKDSGEQCDIKATGADACPDQAACEAKNTTTELWKVEGTGCQAHCVSYPAPAPELCGNTVKDNGEQCDIKATGADACPDQAACEAKNTATEVWKLQGTGCQAHCVSSPAPAPELCGNSVKDNGEQCDIKATGADACPDQDKCSQMNSGCDTYKLVGSGCLAHCEKVTITTAKNGDQCCPPGTNPDQDDDCTPSCGDGFKTSTETCDNSSSNAGDKCPDTAACKGMTSTNACITSYKLEGDATSCSAKCVPDHETTACSMTSDGCCPAACSTENDADCKNTVDAKVGEACDNNTPCGKEGFCHVEEKSSRYYEDGYCTAHCTTDDNCPTNTACVVENGVGECRKNCSTNDECRAGYFCNVGTCQPKRKCALNSDCTAPEACIDHGVSGKYCDRASDKSKKSFYEQCETDSDCGIPGQKCYIYNVNGKSGEKGICTMECSSTDQTTCAGLSFCRPDQGLSSTKSHCFPSCEDNINSCQGTLQCTLFSLSANPKRHAICEQTYVNGKFNEPCRDDADCGEEGFCWKESPPSLASAASPNPKGGLCMPALSSQRQCPEGSSMVMLPQLGNGTVLTSCLKTCTTPNYPSTDCREGYECLDAQKINSNNPSGNVCFPVIHVDYQNKCTDDNSCSTLPGRKCLELNPLNGKYCAVPAPTSATGEIGSTCTTYLTCKGEEKAQCVFVNNSTSVCQKSCENDSDCVPDAACVPLSANPIAGDTSTLASKTCLKKCTSGGNECDSIPDYSCQHLDGKDVCAYNKKVQGRYDHLAESCSDNKECGDHGFCYKQTGVSQGICLGKADGYATPDPSECVVPPSYPNVCLKPCDGSTGSCPAGTTCQDFGGVKGCF